MARIAILLAAGLAASAFGLAQAQVAPTVPPLPQKPPFQNPQDAIVARQAGFKGNGQVFDAMKKAIEAKQDPAPYAGQANWLVQWGQQIPVMFPPGSESGHKTRALPAIWTDKAEFDKDAAAFTAESEKLAKAASSNDKAAFAEAFQATGKACLACHRTFRSKEE